MKGKANLVLPGLVGAAAGLLCHQSFALDATAAASPSNDVLETIVVTAEKRAEPLKDVPMSITALSAATLDNLQARDFQDYAALVPGLSLQTTQPGLTRLTLRGQNAGGVGSTVAVYLDESPFGSSSALLNGSIITGDFDTWDLERIEVLRGPQGTLYGANSEGGLLKFVTIAPVLGSFSGAGEVTGESVQHGGNGGELRGMVNLPLGDKVALRISGYDQDAPGYVDNVLTGQSEVNEGHKYGGRASLLAAPTDDFSIRLTASSQQSKYGGTNTVDVDSTTFQPVHGDLTQARNFAEPSSFKYENYNGLINWNTGPVNILSTTSYSVLNSDQFSDATNVVVAPGSTTTYGDVFNAILAPGTTSLGASLDNAARLKKVTQEIRLSSTGSQALEWQVGGFYTHETANLFQHLLAVNVPGGSATPFPPVEIAVLDSIYKEWAGFANLTYHFNSAFDLQAGARYSSNDQTATENLSGLLATPPQVFTTPSSGNVVTWSVAPRWHIDQDTMLYGRVATGYRPGGPNALPAIAPPDVPREFGADKTINYEAGIRSTQLEGLLSIDFAAFYVDWTNIQLLEQVSGIGIDGNGGKAKSQGVEWTFKYVPVHGLTLTWTGAYTDAKLTTPAPAVHGNTGDALPYAPKWSTSADGEYSWPVFADYKGFVGATWSYVGTRSTDFGSDVTGLTQVSLPSYNTIAARAGIENDRYSVTLYGKNLSDSRGFTSYSSSGAPGLSAVASIIQPLTIGVTLAAKF
ncbi:MAG TPA: TonB-dependent receptor [Steroidobacteraceae bacterium]|jgi:outer membrane receptor protein involved in Fe transport